MDPQQQDPDREERDIARLLKAAGRREQLPDELRLRWEQHFRQELDSVRRERRQRQRRGLLALAASLAVVAIGLTLSVRPPKPDPLLIRVSASLGEVRLENAGAGSPALVAGTRLAAGQVIHTGAEGRLALDYAGYDLRLNRNTVLALASDGVTLRRGEIYASDEGRGSEQRQLQVHTALGTIRDIGTQFTVSVSPGETVATVRRGTVLLETGQAQYRNEAASGSATRISVNTLLEVHSEPVAPNGEAWQWIYQAAPEFKLDGQSALAFLKWSSRESGFGLEFASSQAETYASITTLHGDLGRMDPESAVAPVLATTDLRATVKDGTLLVTLMR